MVGARETTRHVIDYLIMHPDACGDSGTKDYNMDPEYGGKYGEITKAKLHRTRHAYMAKLGLTKMHPCRGPGETANKVKRFLTLYPDAMGEKGMNLYNNHPNFGMAYGKISQCKLENARTYFRKELGLSNMRGKTRTRRTAMDRVNHLEKFFKEFSDAVGQKGLEIYNNHPEYGRKYGEMTKQQMRYARDVLRGNKKIGNMKWFGSVTRKRVKEYLKLHPHAVGRKGAEAYNNDKDFGGKYGQITPDYLNGIRWDCGKEMNLPIMTGKHHDQAVLRIRKFLELYPQAVGQHGADMFNEDPDFGLKYGKITEKQLKNGRSNYNQRIGELSDMRAKPRRKRKGIAPWFKKEQARYFITENPDISEPKDMRKAVKAKLGYTYTKKEIEEMMKERGKTK
jgi:hypothetical protein